MADIQKLHISTDTDQPQDKLETSQNDDDLEASDKESSASDQSDMEPFSDYVWKIEQLLTEIGLVGFAVESLQHGYDFENCVYALRSPSKEEEQFILRVPVFLSNEDVIYSPVLNDVALLNWLVEKLPVPRVKAYSATKDNALEKPFIVQTRLPGRSLDKLWPKLDQADKFDIIDQFVDLVAMHEAITFATAGGLEAPSSMPSSMNDFTTSQPPIVKPFDEGDKEYMKQPQVMRDRAGSDVKALITSHLKGFIANDISREGEGNEFLAPKLRGLLAMIDSLDREGAFTTGAQPVILYHWDLEPRNIMVTKDSGTWHITGIIDWDDTQALSRVLTRKPPSWMWDFEDEEVTGYVDCDFHPIAPLTEKNMALKTRFDTRAAETLPGYLEDAYGAGRWLRRIWLFAKTEIHSTHILDLLDEVLDSWADRAKPKGATSVMVVPNCLRTGEPDSEASIAVVPE